MTRQTILITGTSGGLGRSTARLFHAKGWNVVATMRNPEGTELTKLDRTLVTRPDVQDASSIRNALGAISSQTTRPTVEISVSAWLRGAKFHFPRISWTGRTPDSVRNASER